jgi:hypothetical protein
MMTAAGERARRTRRLAGGWLIAALLAAPAAAGTAPTSPEHRHGTAGGSAPTCVPLDTVPFGPPTGEGIHHVTGTGAEYNPLAFYSFVPQGAFLMGETVDVTLVITNSGTARAAFSFPTAQQYDVVIWNDDCVAVWRWSTGRAFAQVVQSLSVPAHDKVVFHIPWRQRDQAGHQVRMGGYEAQVVFLGTWPGGDAPVVLPPLTFAVR